MKSGYRLAKNKIIIYMSFAILVVASSLVLFACKKKDIRDLATSDPLEQYQVIELSMESKYLNKTIPYIIYLPKGYGDGTEYPVWYGLHSYGTNESMWLDYGIGEIADELATNGEIDPLIMVFPYVKDASLNEIEEDLKDGRIDERNTDKFISQELIPYIDAHYFTVTSSDGRFIGGFSMGGMMALRIGFHHADSFSKIGGYSPAVLSPDYSDKQLEKWLYPNDNMDEIDDVINFAKEKGFNSLNIYMDAGTMNDPFSVGIQSLHKALEIREIQSELLIYEGGHTLQKDSLEDYLKFYVGK